MDNTKLIVSYLDLNEAQIMTSIQSSNIDVNQHKFQALEKKVGDNYVTTLLVLAEDESKLNEWHGRILDFIKRHDDFEGDFYSFMSEIKSQEEFLTLSIEDGNNHPLKGIDFFTRLYTFEF